MDELFRQLEPVLEREPEPVRERELEKAALELAIRNYDHIEQQANLAATKAALLVAAQAVLLTTYVGVAKDFGIFFYYQWSVLGSLFGLAGAFILLALFFSLYAVFPKSRADNEKDLLFFASIKDNFDSAQDYVDAFRKASRVLLEEQLLENIYGKACWLRRNFWYVRASIVMTFLGVVTAALTILVMSPGLLSET